MIPDSGAPLSVKRKAAILAAMLVLGVALSVILNIIIQPAPSRNDMPGGSYHSEEIFNPRPTAYGLLDPETGADGATYRWSTAHATLTYPYIANLGRYADVSMRLSSQRPAGQPPASVTVSLNGKAYSAFDVPNAFQVYSFTLDTRQTPNPYLNPAHVQLDIQSTTYSPSVGKEQGVAIDWIELRPRRGTLEIALMALVWAVALVVVMLVALSRLNVGWAFVYTLGTLITLAVVSVTYAPRAFPPAVEVGLAGLAWLIGVWLAPARRPVWGLALVGICLWAALAGRLLRDWQLDDAYISYRYGWNLAHGYGLVYNPGELQPVEGYTNFLWTLLGAGIMAAGLPPSGAMLAVIIASAMGLVALTYRLAVRLSGKLYAWALLSAGLLALDPSFISYGPRGSGIEAVPFAFLVLLAVTLIWPEGDEENRAQLAAGGFVLALASLTRPEGLGVALVLLGVRAWYVRRDRRRLWRALANIGLPYLLVVAPYQLWRITFYGYPFPNTFYAKTGASLAFLVRGWEYTWQFVVDHWLVAVLVTVGAVMAIVRQAKMQFTPRQGQDTHNTHDTKESRKQDRSREIIVALALTVSLYTLYIIAVGGDHFEEGRFFVPLLAPIVLLAQEAARQGLTLSGRVRHIRRVAGALLAVGLLAYVVTAATLEDPQGSLAKRTNRDTNFVNIWGSAGLWLRDNTPPDTLAASPVAGAIAYYSQRPIVDMLGINDLHIGHEQVANMGSGLAGHEKEDPAYVLDRQPKYILPYPNYFDPTEARFDTEYMTTTVRGPLGPDITWWVRRDARP